jgi:PAS domain S-box-containing protein
MSENPSEPVADLPCGLDSRFCEVMDASPVMIWVSGPDRLRKWFNKSWLECTGRSMADDIGDGWTEGVHRDDLDHCLETYTTHFDARQKFRVQFRLRRHDGQYRWIDDIGVPRFAGDGSFLGYIGSCVDIHDHRQAEAELRRLKIILEQRIGEATVRLHGEMAARSETEQELFQSAAQLEILIQGIKDYAIFMLDPNGYVTSWNSGAERIKGYQAHEILGQHFSCFYTEEDRAIDVPAQALQEAATEGKFEAEGWRLRKDGSRFCASVVIDAIHNESGKLIGFAKITRDITDKRLAQEQLEQAQERMRQMQKMDAVGQLTGGVAHDFNNLLMVILGNLEIAQRNAESENPSPIRLNRALGSAMEGARRAATLTQRLLAFSRRQPLDPRPLDLNRFIAGEVDFLQRTLGENVDTQAVGTAGLWKVEVDLNQLTAALLNLAVNARDAMPDGGKLTIETSNAFLDDNYCRANPEVQPGQYVLLSVTDNGTGMTPEVIDRAFEPFFSTKAAGHGTGLGLSQVYGFIKQSGGHLKIYSEVGEGTCITIYLPRSDGDEAMEWQEDNRKPVEGDGGETILIVEDDEGVRAYLIEILRDLNYHILAAPHADAALKIIERRDVQIDLLLTDVVLPGMNGRELATNAQSIRPGLIVLFMTGYSRNAIVHQGRLDPGIELIQKPVTQDQLATRIRALLDAGASRKK